MSEYYKILCTQEEGSLVYIIFPKLSLVTTDSRFSYFKVSQYSNSAIR